MRDAARAAMSGSRTKRAAPGVGPEPDRRQRLAGRPTPRAAAGGTVGRPGRSVRDRRGPAFRAPPGPSIVITIRSGGPRPGPTMPAACDCRSAH